MNILKRCGVLVFHKIVYIHIYDGLGCLGGLPPAVFVIFSVEKLLTVLVHDVVINAGAVLSVEKRAGVEHK